MTLLLALLCFACSTMLCAQDHWSLRPPVAARVPDTCGDPWCHGVIDAFVLQRLQAESLEPSPSASRETLIRRLTLDLTGLPPTPQQVHAFVSDDGPRAYEKVVDRLLASPAFGERMTLAWMDAARYGDTSALNADGFREMWPWRDWVINAYNANKPFDEFLIEQLAGDLLPNPTIDQLVATGFNRNNGTSDENGAIAEELRINYVVDRVQTTFNVFQGLSMECAQCHDHKYDPITQKEYYGIFAFFNSVSDPGLQTREGNQPPLAYLPDDELSAQLQQINRQIAQQSSEFQNAVPSEEQFDVWCDSLRNGNSNDLVAGDWYVLGDFCGGTLAHVFTPNQYQPLDGQPDLSADDGEFVWTRAADWYDGEPNRTWMTRSSARYFYRHLSSPSDRSTTLTVSGADDFRVWLNGQRLTADRKKTDSGKRSVRATLRLRSGDNHLVIKLGAKKNGTLQITFALSDSVVPKAALVAAGSDAPTDQASLRPIYKNVVWNRAADFRSRIRELQARRDLLLAKAPTTMVMADRPQMRPTFVLDRGEYDARGDRVRPHVPEALPPLPTGAPPNRLGLARWMVSPDQPLTARVAVNRYWAMLFGNGLVRTPMDFGTQGDPPTHPALLDWLSRDFVASGWDVKRMIKQIAMSSTYRQSSQLNHRLLKQDPENRLMARAARFRLSGEFIRNQALVVSGLMVDAVGGPSVKPYQPPGLWKEVSDASKLRYVRDSGSKLFRRGMYVYWKRSSPHPALTTFDTPNREICQIGRMQTNTPLQAFVLLNDETYVETARHLARRMIREGGDDFESRIQYGYRLCTARSAEPEEIAVLQDVYQHQMESFHANPNRAIGFLAHGDSPADTSLDSIQHAAWTVLAQMLLNLDEVINRE